MPRCEVPDLAELNKREPATARRVRLSWVLAVFAVLFALQIVLYWESFGVQPSGDDFAGPVADIWRGQAEGAWALLARSAQPHNYRPLQSLSVWAAAGISDDHRLLAIHMLHFAGMMVFALAAALWLSVMPISRLAVMCAGCVLFAHPALVAPLAGIDGFSTLFSTGLMWISVWMLWRFRDRLHIGLAGSLSAFVLAIGFKEYALGAVPLACLAMLCFSQSRREAITRALIVGLAFSIVTLGIFFLRKFTIPPPEPGVEIGYFIIAPLTWIKNAALLGGVVMFPGSSTWVFLNQTAVTLAITAGAIGIVAGVLLVGLTKRAKLNARDVPSATSEPAAIDVRRWIAFGVIGLAFASFPAVLIFHVSEMYAAGMVIALVMLVALATDGMIRSSFSLRTGAAFVFAASLVWMTLAVRGKIDDMRESGERAMAMLDQIDSLIPADASNVRIGVVVPSPPPFTPRYSVFVVADDLLCAQPQALQWLRPHSGIRLEFHESTDGIDRTTNSLSAAMLWDGEKRQMKLQFADWSQ